MGCISSVYSSRPDPGSGHAKGNPLQIKVCPK